MAKIKEKKAHVSSNKTETLSELVKLAKNSRTILLASIKSVPLSQYQEIAKKLRGKAVVKVPRKSLVIRTLDSVGHETAERFKTKIENSTALFFSDLDAFDLASELANRRSPAKAKAGQEAPADIEVPAGPTELTPGPAISELGALGIQIQIDKGKIAIKEAKVIAKKGEKISQGAADIMSKLGIKPFTIGFIPLAAVDVKEKKVYLEIRIDTEGTIKEMVSAYAKALPFAVNLGYTSSDTISFVLQKAVRQGMAMETIVSKRSGSHSSEQTNTNEPVSEDSESKSSHSEV